MVRLGIFVLFSILRQNSPSHLNMILAINFPDLPLITLRNFFLNSYFVECFYQECLCWFCQMFLLHQLKLIIQFSFWFVNVANYTDFFLNVNLALSSWDRLYLIMMYYSFCVLLNLVCENFVELFESTFMRSVSLEFSCNIFVCF